MMTQMLAVFATRDLRCFAQQLRRQNVADNGPLFK